MGKGKKNSVLLLSLLLIRCIEQYNNVSCLGKANNSNNDNNGIANFSTSSTCFFLACLQGFCLMVDYGAVVGGADDDGDDLVLMKKEEKK